MNKISFLLLLIGLSSCNGVDTIKKTIEYSPSWEVETIETPAPPKSGEANIFMREDGMLYLSWIMHLDSSYALQYANFDGAGWSEATTIAAGKDWFVNWADFPAMAVRANGSMAAHWLEKSTGGTYDYDVKVSQSQDGKAWNDPFTLHQDGVPAEHGFVSMQVMPDQQIMAVWLDGRMTKQEGGAMTLRSVTFDSMGQRAINTKVAVDERICDCCQTDLALTPSGAVAVYRNRTKEEVRDIYIARYQAGQWSEGVPVFEDHWLINGCPVNGPAVSTMQQKVAVAWFAAPDNNKRIRLAISNNEGRTFEKTVLLDSGQVLGRVDIAWLDSAMLAVSWMANVQDQAVVKLAKIDAQGTIAGIQTILETDASRSSGFPILAHSPHGLYLAYRHMQDSVAQVRLLRLKSEGS